MARPPLTPATKTFHRMLDSHTRLSKFVGFSKDMISNREKWAETVRGSLDRGHPRLALALLAARRSIRYRRSRQLSHSIVSPRYSRVPRARRSRQCRRGRGRDRAESPRALALVHLTRSLFRDFSQDPRRAPALTSPTGSRAQLS